MKRLSFVSLCLLALLAITNQSCHKDPEPAPEPCVLSKIQSRYDTLERFVYNEAGQLVTHILSDFTYKLQYNGAGQLVRVLYSYALDQSAREFEITLTHANDGKTVVIRVPSSPLPNVEEHTAELNDNGQLLSYSIPDGSNRIVHRYEYNGDGDLLKRFYAAVTPTGTSEGLWYTNENFDGKPNPYFTSKSLRMYFQLIHREPVSRHNFLLTKHYDGNGEVYRTDTRTYAYNGQGQLVSQSVQIMDKTFLDVPLSYDLAYTYYCP